MSDRVVICGAGVIGSSIAYYLALRGVAATVVERRGVACAASGKSGGFLALDWCDGSPLAALARKSFELHAELARRLDGDYGYRRLETFAVATNAAGSTPAGRSPPGAGWIDGQCLGYSVLGSAETTAQVHPERFTRALMAAAIERGARVLTGRVEGLELIGTPPRVQGVRVDGELVGADKVIISMGPWSSSAAQWLPLPPIGGLKGFSITLRPRAPVPAQALFVDYLMTSGARESPEIVPRPDGQVYVCGLSDDVELPEDPAEVRASAPATRTLCEVAARLASCLDSAPVLSEHACYRPICGDGLPLMGSVANVEGAFVATGHSCWGILNAPASGLAMSELVIDGAARSVDLRPFTPERLTRARA